MSTWFNVSRMIVALVGVAGFGLLMALREAVSGVAMRSAVAALAFAWGAASVIWLIKSRQ